MKLIYPFLFCLILFTSCNEKSPDYLSDNFVVTKLTDGVYACIHKLGGKAICNAGIIDNGNETIIFDTFLAPETAKELINVVHHYKLSPIKYVINSHYHNDHIRGNQVFGENAKIVSTKITEEFIAEWEPKQIEYESEFAHERFAHYDSLLSAYEGDSTDAEFTDIQMWRPYYEILSKSSNEVKTRLPNIFIEEKKDLSGPDLKVTLETQGKGHTDSDIILYLPEKGIIFTGDLVFYECHPYLGHGYPEDWKNYLNYLVSLNYNTVVPGHGEIGNITSIKKMIQYISDLEGLTKNMTSENISEIQIPDEYKEWLFDRFFQYNLSFLLSEHTEAESK